MPGVLIAGAGIGGLTAALALARTGVRVSLLERATAFESIGAGLQISPNAARVLADLGLLDAVAARATQPTGVHVRSARTARTLSRLSLADAAKRWGAPYLVAHRADLQAVLAAAVADEPGIDLYLGTTLAGFGTTARGIVATARQGRISRSFEADALIGADGVHSTVRARLVGGIDDRPTETGRTAWRATIDAARAPRALAVSEAGLWLGHDAHLVHYPISRGDRLNIVAITRDTLPIALDRLWEASGDGKALAARFRGWHPLARELIAAAPAWSTWPLYDRAPLPAWHAGPVALLGDAAHPILPFLAQGAAQAIEDAAALAHAVAGIAGVPGVAGLQGALAAYSTARAPRAARIQAVSREQGRLYHLGGLAALARDAAMRLAGPKRLLARYDWVYGAIPASVAPAYGTD